MVVVKSGSLDINLGIFKLSGDLSEEDRQAAWELYTEISTRVAVSGKRNDKDKKNFDGEIYVESLNSLFTFFQEARRIMRSFPVGRIKKSDKNHLGIVINNVMLKILRPFLEKWQANYRHWWENESNPNLSPFDRQSQYPKLKELLADWTELRIFMSKLENNLVKNYQLLANGKN